MFFNGYPNGEIVSPIVLLLAFLYIKLSVCILFDISLCPLKVDYC